MPKSNRVYWKKKIARNRARDLEVTSSLRALGWTVLRFWEHETTHNLASVIERIKEVLNSIEA
jgi:DNA mismatch endonuclease, patch repair protein